MRRSAVSVIACIFLFVAVLPGCSCSTPGAAVTVLRVAEGSVCVIRGSTGDCVEVQSGMSLERGDIIRTWDDSRAQITFFDGTTVDLEAGTEVELVLLAGSADTASTTIRLRQVIGSIVFRVYKIIDSGSSYQVETPTAEVAVRGSAMRVDVIEDGTTLITNLEGDIWASAQGVELQIPQGWQCIIRPGEPPQLISEEVTFPDPNLEAAIREAIEKPTGDIYPSDLEGLTRLDARERGIADLTGLEYCTDLTHLYLLHNEISELSPLSNLISLRVLWLDENQISDVYALANLTGLTDLQIGLNEIIDISPLANLINLAGLGLCCNQISDISALSNLTSLTSLSLWINKVSDISALAGLTKLSYLSLGDNQISKISLLEGLTNLSELWLHDNNISDIKPLVDNTGLGEGDEVYLYNNPLSEDSVNVYIPALEARGVTVEYWGS